jgi:CBS domain-containing protein
MGRETFTVGQLMRDVPLLRPTDSVGRAAEVLRCSVYSVLPVVEEGRVVGLVTEEQLRGLFPLVSRNGSNGDGRPLVTVAHIMLTDVKPVPEAISLPAFAELLDQQTLDALPVMDGLGRYRGMMSRADAVAAETESIRPPVVGGMATPFGVYLTTGALRAGAGHLGLFLTGACIGLFMVVSQIVVTAGCLLVDRAWGTSYHQLYAGKPVEELLPPLWVIFTVFTTSSMFLFLLMMRLTPLAGYHAAEHQVVHAIERAEPLIPEIVRQMPRPHPRCGTNLVVAMSLLSLALLNLPRLLATGVVLATILSWRTIGAWIQQHFTTKPANDKQLLSGIRAGEELLRKHREYPEFRATFFQRVLNMGLIQALAGALAVLKVWEFLLFTLQRWSVGL